MKRRLPWMLALVALGCESFSEEPATSETPAEAPAATPAAAGDADLAPPEAGDGAEPAASAITLPDGWSGTGVLAKREAKLPRRAPSWAKVVAEVVDKDGQRLLVTSGEANKIKDAHLSRSTAEARARAELSRWTGQNRIAGSSTRAVWRDPKSGATFAQIELPVPAGWVPGQPISVATP